MKELSTTNQGLTIQKNEVQHILQNQPAYLEDFDNLYNEVLAQLLKSINHLGWTIPEKTSLQIIVNELTTSIQNNHKSLRKEEIAVCFAKGIRQEYGEFFGISVVTFDRFIYAYLASDYRAELGKSLPKAELLSPSKELTRDDRISFASKAFEKFKECGNYNDLGNIIYEFLDAEKLIPFTTPEKFEMLEEARAKEYARLQNPLTQQQSREFNKQIEALISSNDKIIPQSKRIALNRYFKILKDQGAVSIPFK